MAIQVNSTPEVWLKLKWAVARAGIGKSVGEEAHVMILKSGAGSPICQHMRATRHSACILTHFCD